MNRMTPKPELRYVVIQTPMGIFKFAVPVVEGPDPVKIAMEMFQANVDGGEGDPLLATLTQLKTLAQEGSDQPLITGLMLLRQMAEKGLVPPLPELIHGTGITQQDLNQAGANNPGLFDRIDQQNLN